jgi:hypothetical protein
MLSRIAVGCLVLGLAGEQQVHASEQPAVAAATAGETADASSALDQDWFKKSMGPFTFAAGPATSGGFGITLDGNQSKALPLYWSNMPGHAPAESGWYYFAHPSVTYSADGILVSKKDSPSNISLDLDPGIDLGVYTGPLHWASSPVTTTQDGTIVGFRDVLPESRMGFGVRGDLRYRYGTFKEDNALQDANQAIAGGSLYWVPWVIRRTPFLVDPQITASYYKPFSTHSSTVSVPSDIKANYFQGEFHTQVGTAVLGPLIALDIKYDASKPTTGTSLEWQNLWQLQLSMAIGTSSIKPAVTYKSGAQGGFQYDKQVLIGFLTEFLKPST